MRWLLLFMLLSCSTPMGLKFKHHSGKRYLASLTRDDLVVKKISVELKNPVLFASGMDSTFLIVKLFDEEGNEIIEVDPNDLSLSTSEDVEAKPFVRKQGIYKAELRPSVKSKAVRIRVDWKEKVLSEEIILRTTTAPLANELTPLHHDFFQSKSVDEISVSRGSETPETGTESFELSNVGDNRIVNTKKSPSAQREFRFDYLEQARQNLALEVADAPNGTVSHTKHSLFMFFPRKHLFIVEQLSGTIDVTLPTGEKLIFQRESKEIVDGVMTEGPLDGRYFADLKYRGRGVVLRANAQGQSPQLGQSETSKIDLDHGSRGSADVLIIHGPSGQRCRRPKTDFWEPLDVSPIEFKFPTDEEFDRYLKAQCGFGIPKL